MAKLRKARNVSLVKDVSQQIEEAILSGEYKPGDRLPTTRDLQDILGASLGTIRESLAILEQKGLLEVRKGAKGGFFICQISTKPMADSLQTLMQHMVFSHKELYEFRIPVEMGLIRMVVEKANDEHIESFLKCLEKLKKCLGQGNPGWIKFVGIELDLRRQFINVANNKIYQAVLTPILDNLKQYAFSNLPGGNEEVQIAYDYWYKIVHAIADKNEKDASEFLSELLNRFMEIILDYSGEHPKKLNK